MRSFPLSDKAKRWSPYNYASNNPIRFIDPDGMDHKDNGDELVRAKYTVTHNKDKGEYTIKTEEVSEDEYQENTNHT